MRYNDEELSFLIFFLEGPEFLAVDNFDGFYHWSLIERAGVHIVHDLYIENVFVCFLAAQVHMLLWSKGI
jgi:hypothetical protein